MPFEGRVLTEWLTVPPKRHRKMLLDEDFSFTDSNNKKWTAKKGDIINGISYPEYRKYQSRWQNFLFTLGSVPIKFFNWCPYTGNARRASVVHDKYCKTQTESPSATHRMFYEAMLEDLTPKWQADIMYWAVRKFKKW